MTQLDLFPLKDVLYLRTMTLYENFVSFHRANPHVYRAFVTMALEAKAKGRGAWSSVLIFEVLRWSSLQTTGEEWKLNNNFRAFYSRMAMRDIPALDGFFRTREMKAA